jgi:hypothetical protein
MLRRRRFLVHKQLQYRLLRGTLRQISLFGIVALVIIFVPLFAQQWTHRAGSVESVNAAEQLLFLHLRFWPTFVLAAIFIGLDSFRISHKIAGPLLVFRRVLEDLRDGQIPEKIGLRQGDFFHRECELLNHAIQRVETRREVEAKTRASIAASAERVHTMLDDPNTPILPEQRELIENLLDQLADSDREAGNGRMEGRAA